MKEAIVKVGPKVYIVDSLIPIPNDDQVVIKVVYSGSNPKDWKTPEVFKVDGSGDDIAGTVHSVGANVTEFKVGDRVAAFHEMRTPGTSYAEYAVTYQYTTFHLPKHTTFEEAATIPLAAMTAALGIFKRLELPQPWTPAKEPTPLIIYGAASAVGAFGVKFAGQANIHPLLCVAGRGIDFVKKLPGYDESKGDAVIDYREGDEAVVDGLKNALKASGARKVFHALDATSINNSHVNILGVLDHVHGKLCLVLSIEDSQKLPQTVKQDNTRVGDAHGEGKDFANVYFRHISRGLATGTFSGHPYEVRKGGLNAIEQALSDLKAGKASATKYIFKLDETEGYGKD